MAEIAELKPEKDMDSHAPEFAVDFDGCLAFYDGFKGHNLKQLGEPVPAMLEQVKYWLWTQNKVVIFTARATADKEGEFAISQIKLWLKKYGIEEDLEVTNIKKRSFVAMYDDRAFHVIKNQGIIIGVIK
jgi:hypothetical protein